MPSTRELRRHIRSIRSTRQITRAMEMVATAKLRRATDGALGGRPYIDRITKIINDTVQSARGETQHPLLEVRPVKKTVLVVISSDRGLAGGYNANIARTAQQYVTQEKQAGREVVCVTLGKKAESILRRLGIEIIQSYEHTRAHPTLTAVLPIASALAELYAEETCDQVVLLATRFYSVFKQTPETQPLLPLELKSASPMVNTPFLYEPTAEEMLDVLVPRYLATLLFQELQESLAAEHAARRMAMHSATDNASDLLDHLQLTYNNVRQNTITREITEITAGAAAISES